MTKHTPLTPDPADRNDAGAALPDNALVPVAARHDGWTPERQRSFIETLADTGNVTAAAQAVGMTVQSAWRLRRRADARGFDLAWEAAMERSLQQLLPVAIDRALNGTLRQRFYHGELIAEERVHHDGLLLHLLERGARGLGAGPVRGRLNADWEGNMAALEAGEALPVEQPDAPEEEAQQPFYHFEIDGRWLTNLPYPPGVPREALDAGPPSDGMRYATDDEAKIFARWMAEENGEEDGEGLSWDEADRRRYLELD